MSIVLDNMLKTMSTTQASEYFGVHIKTIFRWINSGKLSAEKINGQWHVQIDEHDAQDNAQSNVQTDVQNAQDMEQNAQDNVQTDEKERLINQLQVENDHLHEQLQRRDEQLDHLTQVVAMSQKNIAALTEQLDSSRQMIEDMRQRRSVWQRLKAVFVAESV